MDLKTLFKAVWCYVWHVRANILGQERCGVEGCPFQYALKLEVPIREVERLRIVPSNTIFAPIVCPKCGNNFQGQARYALVSTQDPPQPFLNSRGEIIAGFAREEIELYAQTLNRDHATPVAKAIELDVPTWVIIAERTVGSFEVLQPNSEIARDTFDRLVRAHQPVYLCRIEKEHYHDQ